MRCFFPFFTIISLLSHQLAAQPIFEKRYDVTYSSGGTFTPLSLSAIDVGYDSAWDDDISDPIALPFEFKFQNVLVENVRIESFGSLILNDASSVDLQIGHITGINMDYASSGRGKVLYETVGGNGERIFKVEFRNVGRQYDFDVPGNDTLNFQIWLYESDNAIEYRAGYSNVPDSEFAERAEDLYNGREGIIVGLFCNETDEISTTNSDIFVHATRFTSGDFLDTTIAFAPIIEPTPDLSVKDFLFYGGYPLNGSVIRFGPTWTPTNLSKIDFDMASVYPNPSSDGIFTLRMKDAIKAGSVVNIFDINGRLFSTQALSQSETKLDLSNVVPGQYFGRIINGDRQGLFKVTKQ